MAARGCGLTQAVRAQSRRIHRRARDLSPVDRGRRNQTLEAITKSRFTHPQAKSSQVPVQVITSADIGRPGSHHRRHRPAPLGRGSISTAFGRQLHSRPTAAASARSTTISLRNLARSCPDHRRPALGQRVLGAGVSAAVDLNTIPASAVDHRVLTDGASSLYGSDAIAGVSTSSEEEAGRRCRAPALRRLLERRQPDPPDVSLSGGNDLRLLRRHQLQADSISSAVWNQSRFPVPAPASTTAVRRRRAVFVRRAVRFWWPLPDNFCNIAGDGAACRPSATSSLGRLRRQQRPFAPFNLLLTPSEQVAVRQRRLR